MKIKTRERRDKYYRKAKSEGYRARSAFKLLHLADEYGLFNAHTRSVIDLCAAPGSWAQVLSRVLLSSSKDDESVQVDQSETETGGDTSKDKEVQQSTTRKQRCRVVAVDIQEMAPIDGVDIIKGDITLKSTLDRIIDLLDGKQHNSCQLVLCDGAPEVSGLHALDEYLQSQLLHSALAIVANVLEPGGTFVGKVFKTENLSLLCTQYRIFFKEVIIAKPPSSRSNSIESFIVCRGFRMPSAPPAPAPAPPKDNSGNGAESAQSTRSHASFSAYSDPRDRTISAASTPASGKRSLDDIDRGRAVSLNTPSTPADAKHRSSSVFSTPPSFYNQASYSPGGTPSAPMLLSSFIANGDLSAFDSSDSPYWTINQSVLTAEEDGSASSTPSGDRGSKRKVLVYSGSSSSSRKGASGANANNSPVLPVLAHHLQWKRRIEERRGRKSSLSSFGRLSAGDEEEAGLPNNLVLSPPAGAAAGSSAQQNTTVDTERSGSSSRSNSPNSMRASKLVNDTRSTNMTSMVITAIDEDEINEDEVTDEDDEEEEVETLTKHDDDINVSLSTIVDMGSSTQNQRKQ